ncbi:UDP-4-amino-4-deoxy-L-arabinose--oxoglutarate aminotransferase [Paenibacillus plantiphilus]|uniref:UDP-4-amino-4-deoxy-L-arabinose--oxoglutarate aminotransferase n=1 Tax=Paenibacillus plantiphilus TaxID=2905650 RepID=A0ABM9C647_9BACL|nr:DegT/DnrJ/EryC1/StrS family aminotransferase [Paenibacillus plantiphilus]CAH1203693.1 UDP-4-amino-4-deoxy-L-arabinose--oxoglutarate aminotransferase [Paenibacillus plantiphilus]
MKTDFIRKPLSLPSEDWIRDPLAFLGGPSVIPEDVRKTNFPIITKEDVFQMLVSVQQDGEDVVNEFKEAYRQYVGANYAIATASGTASLHLALAGVGVQPGDEVIVPAFTFIATAQAVVAAKAIPIFVDIDPITYCLDPVKTERAITSRTKAIMPVHVHGLPADLPALRSLADSHSLRLVEDASHAHSASIHGQLAGSIGDSAGQSLMADKNFAVGGEGGIAFFKEQDDYERALRFLESSGIDYRMSWIAAAFGLSQLDRLPYYDAIRARNAAYLTNALSETRLFSGPFVPEGYKHSYNMYRIKLSPERLGLDDLEDYRVKDAVQQLINHEGVYAREWQNVPIPGHLPFKNRQGFGNGYPFTLSDRQDFGYDLSQFPETLKMLRNSLTICRELRTPIEYERIQAYALAFKKIDANPHIIRELVEQSSDPTIPYARDARLG